MWLDYRCQNIIIFLFLIRQTTENVSLLGFPNLIIREFSDPTSVWWELKVDKSEWGWKERSLNISGISTENQ